MLYNKPNRLSPPNTRVGLYRQMAKSYEPVAREKSDNAFKMANYEITYYGRLSTGKMCNCTRNIDDILDDTGNMSDGAISQVLKASDDTLFSDGSSRGVRIEDYGKSRDTFIPTEEKFNDDNEESVEGDTDYEAEVGEESPNDFQPYAYVAANCPLCLRTGYIGGYNLRNGTRIVRGVESFLSDSLQNCHVDDARYPYMLCPNSNWAKVTVEVVLPKNPALIKSWRLLNGFDALVYDRDWSASIDGHSIGHKNGLLNYCDGRPHLMELSFRREMTHMELELLHTKQPTFVDISEFTKEGTVRSNNELGSLTVTLPPSFVFASRGDIFFEKLTQALWVVIDVNVLKSSDMVHGITVTGDRVKTQYEPFNLSNPYR